MVYFPMTMVQGHMIMIYFSLAMTHNPVTVNNCLSHHLIGEQYLQNGSLSYHNESLSLYKDPQLHHNLLLSFSIFHIPNTLIHCPLTDIHFLITMIHTVIHCPITMVYCLIHYHKSLLLHQKY